MVEKKRVLVGRWNDSLIVACSEEAIERHRKWNEDLFRGPTWGELRTTGLVDVDWYWAEEFEEDGQPTDADPIDPNHYLIANGELDWHPTEQTISEFGELLRDLGEPDPGRGMFYQPVEFVIPENRLDDVVARLEQSGHEVVATDVDFMTIWY